MSSYPDAVSIEGEIPALIWRAPNIDRGSTIITLHGGGGSKLDVDPKAVERANAAGVSIVSVDVYMHGEHVSEGFDRRTLGEGRLAIFLEIYEHTARDLFTVVHYLADDMGVPAERVGLRGGSMGGYIVLAAMGMGIPVGAALSVCGAADYATTFRHRLRRQGLSEERIVAELNEVSLRIPDVDPIYHPEAFPPRPVMMIHGEHDPLVPIAAHRALYDRLTPLYRDHPERCLFVTHADGHETPPALEELGWTWLLARLSE